MKISAGQARSYFDKPDADRAGALLYGADPMRVALRRQQVIAGLIGPAGEEEMRLTRLPASEVRRDPAQLIDALKAIGFFPGPRVVFVEDATDQVTPTVLEALAAWSPGDAQIIVTAGQLRPTSKLRKGFETHPSAYAIGIYNDPPGRDEIERDLAEAGLRDVPRETMQALMDLAGDLEPGDFRQTVEKIGLYKHGDDTSLSLADVAACAPSSIEAELDDVLLIISEGRTDRIAPVMQRLRAQGVNAVTLCIGAMRHFRTLHRVACDTTGRPQVWGPNRDAILSQARRWGPARLEAALTMLTDTDLELRSAGQNAPAIALVERAFIRIATLGARA